jgi:hypothetical protein
VSEYEIGLLGLVWTGLFFFHHGPSVFREIRKIRLPEAWNRITLGYFGYSDTGTELGTEPDRFGYRVIRFGFGDLVLGAQSECAVSSQPNKKKIPEPEEKAC